MQVGRLVGHFDLFTRCAIGLPRRIRTPHLEYGGESLLDCWRCKRGRYITPPAQLQLNLCRLRGRRSHIPRLLHDRLRHVRRQGRQRHGRRQLRAEDINRSGAVVQHGERARHRVVRLRGAQRGAGDPGHHLSTPETPSKKPMWRGVVVAYAIVALCYFSVAFAGYYAFGSSVDPNVLITLDKPRWLIAAANLMVVVHVIFAMPMFDMIETLLVKEHKYKPGILLRLIARSAYAAATMFIGMTFPFFDGLLGFFGGFGFAPTTYLIPCIMWLMLKKPKKYGLIWFINIICIVIGVLLTLVSSIGGMRQIILDARNYKLYS